MALVRILCKRLQIQEVPAISEARGAGGILRKGTYNPKLCLAPRSYLTLGQLPDSFKDFVGSHSGKGKVGKGVLAHCLRELFHSQWKILLDDEFMDAYENGFVVDCSDGVKRRFFPRILTYSADYPEKWVVVPLS